MPTIGTTNSRDAQPASRISSSAAQPFIFDKAIGLLLLGFLVEGGERLFSSLLLLQRLPGLRRAGISNLGEIRLTARLIH
ncbi:hypothetical protein D3C85_1747000 [compost metagenome]